MAFILSYVSFYGESPTAHEVSTLSASDIPNLTHSGYAFDGWYYDTQYTSQATVGDTLSNDTVIYAKWNSGNDYSAVISSHTILSHKGSPTVAVRYGSIEIPSPSQNHNVVLQTQGKIVENQITLDGQSIGETNKVYSGNVTLSAIKFLSEPLIGIRGDSIYILDTTNNESDEIDISASGSTIGTLYRVNQTIENVTSSVDSYTFVSNSLPIQIVYTAVSGYTLPSSVTVSNANYEWDSNSGILLLSNPSDVVSVAVRGVAV